MSWLRKALVHLALSRSDDALIKASGGAPRTVRGMTLDPRMQFLEAQARQRAIPWDKMNVQILRAQTEANYPMVSHFVIYNGGTDQEAKDVYQETIIVIYEKINDRSLGLNCKLKTYLYSVCRNLWLKQISKKGKFAGRIEDLEEFLPIEEDNGMEAEKNHLFEIMNNSMLQIGEPCFTLLNDFYIRKMNMNDIAEKFGYTNADTENATI